MRIALVAVFLLLITGVSALSFPNGAYLIVVGKNAPAEDVVVAANFAASMKSFSGVTFTAVTDEDAYAALTEQDLAAKTVVVINGDKRQVKITSTETGAAAKTYFASQGFQTLTLESKEDLLLTPKPEPVKTEPEVQQEPEKETEYTETAVEPPIPVNETKLETQTDVQAPAPEPVVTVQDEPKPGVFVKIWHWFAGLF